VRVNGAVPRASDHELEPVSASTRT
jgi:hypothetical protein